MSGAKTIDDITGIAVGFQAAIESYPVTVHSNIENVTVDTDAAFWLPDDAPPFLPVRIYGDGNCLPRCASLMAYGTQDHYNEMRILIALELAIHMDTQSLFNLPQGWWLHGLTSLEQMGVFLDVGAK